jgi:c-di-GMP-binding flagellar brake protein YcgR
MKERRKHVRTSAAWRVRYRIVDGATHKYLPVVYRGESVNLGAGGMLLATDEELKPGSVLELETLLESDRGDVCRRVTATGKVLETQKTGAVDGHAYLVRIQVTGISPLDKQLLGRTVERRVTAG